MVKAEKVLNAFLLFRLLFIFLQVALMEKCLLEIKVPATTACEDNVITKPKERAGRAFGRTVEYQDLKTHGFPSVTVWDLQSLVKG